MLRKQRPKRLQTGCPRRGDRQSPEFYFDDRSWTVRYLIADTGGWLSGRTVLISPYALDPANERRKVIPVT